MHPSHIQNDPGRNFNFNRRWQSSLPLSEAEQHLAALRAKFGNAEGQWRFQAERQAQLGWRK